MITTAMIDATTAAVSEFWSNEMSKKVDYAGRLYNTKPTNLMQENFHGLGAMGLMTDWTGTVDYQDFDKGWHKGFVQAKRSAGLRFDERVFRYKEYSQLEEQTGLLLDSVYNTRQAHGVAIFQNAFSAAHAGPDGVALCAANHPASPSNSTDTQGNVGDLELTIPNLIETFKKMSGFKDDKGNKVFVQPDMLITGIEYWDVAKKICGTGSGDKEPFTAENDANIMKQELSYFYYPLLTGKIWFLVDSNRMKRRLKWFDGRIPKPEREQDFDTEAIKFKVVGEWANGFTNWEWVYGHNAS